MKKAIAYYRVSTDRQGQSRLGLEAQQAAVSQFAGTQGYDVAVEYTEIESGKKNDRPELAKALLQCRKEKAILIIAKLDRLGRNVAFISNLMESSVEFKAVDNPHANKLLLHMLAAFAEHEREQISSRTKEALRAAKKRGVILGKHGKNVLSQQNRESADKFALVMQPIIKKLQDQGFITIRKITAKLNELEMPTFRGKTWHLASVHRLVKKIESYH